jgi:hypothetical protein
MYEIGRNGAAGFGFFRASGATKPATVPKPEHH